MTLLILCAGFKHSGLADYNNYLFAYLYENERMELSFSIISKISKFINNSHYTLFLIYAILGVSTNMIAIKKLSSLLFLSVVIYVSNFYIYHELVQIRAGVAVGILLLSIPFLYERKPLPYFLLCMIAVFFHYSAIVAIPLYFLSKENINPLKWGILMVCAIIINLYKLDFMYLIKFIPINFIQDAYHRYRHIQGIEELNFGTRQIIDLLIVFVMLCYSKKIAVHNKYFILLIKIYMIGIITRFVLFQISVFAGRISDIYLTAGIILIPMLVHVFKHKAIIIAKIIVICIGLAYLYSRSMFLLIDL
jgi:hypothetical protein